MQSKIWAAAAAVFAAGVILYMAGSAGAQKAATPVAGGIKAAEFALTDIDGKPVKLSDYKGKVIILDFWATWCPPCRKEIPHFNALSKKYGEKGLVVLGVSVDQDGAGAVKKFKASNEVNYRIAMSNDATYGIYQGYLPKDERGGIPFTFIIDKTGVIRQHYVGYRDMDVFETAIKALL